MSSPLFPEGITTRVIVSRPVHALVTKWNKDGDHPKVHPLNSETEAWLDQAYQDDLIDLPAGEYGVLPLPYGAALVRPGQCIVEREGRYIAVMTEADVDKHFVVCNLSGPGAGE